MRTFSSLSGLLGVFAFAAAAVAADSKHPPPASAADAAATQAAIAALAKGPLHDLGGAIDKLNARLDSLEAGVKQANRTLGEVNLPELARREAATQSAAAELSSRQDSLDNALAGAQARLAESAAAADTAIRALRERQANSEARLGAVQHGTEDRVAGVAQALSAQISAAAAAREQAAAGALEKLERAGLAAAALLAALIVAASWLGIRGRLAHQIQLSLALARQGAELRQALAAVPPPPADRSAPPSLNSAVGPAGGRAATPAAWPTAEGARLNLADPCSRSPAEPAGNGAVPQSHQSAPPSPPSEKPTVSIGPLAEPAVASRLLWPAEFLDPESPLSRWRFLLESHLADDDHPALPVLTHLLDLRALLRAPAAATPAEIASALFRLSESLHAYWHSLADLSAEDRQQASAAWLQGMRALLSAAPSLDLREIMPGSRVDPDLMHAVSEGSGNHLKVADVFSWAVVDRGGDRPRILHRAQIAST